MKPWLRWTLAVLWSLFSIIVGLETMRQVDLWNARLHDIMNPGGIPWMDVGFPTGMLTMFILLAAGCSRLLPMPQNRADKDSGR